jgi:hypothetical protein
MSTRSRSALCSGAPCAFVARQHPLRHPFWFWLLGTIRYLAVPDSLIKLWIALNEGDLGSWRSTAELLPLVRLNEEITTEKKPLAMCRPLELIFRPAGA